MEEEKPKRKSREMLKNRRMGNPENKLLGKATSSQIINISDNAHIEIYDFFNWGEMSRDVFFLEDLLQSQIAQPFHKGYQVKKKKMLQSNSLSTMSLTSLDLG